MVGVLHTWTRNLTYHPHVHFIAPGGGITPDGKWVSSGAHFLVHVKPLSKIFRAKFRDQLKKAGLFEKESATDQVKYSTMPAEEFIRRFLQHVLPDRFVKVRYYGLLSPGNRHLLEKARQSLAVNPTEAHTIHTDNSKSKMTAHVVLSVEIY